MHLPSLTATLLFSATAFTAAIASPEPAAASAAICPSDAPHHSCCYILAGYSAVRGWLTCMEWQSGTPYIEGKRPIRNDPSQNCNGKTNTVAVCCKKAANPNEMQLHIGCTVNA